MSTKSSFKKLVLGVPLSVCFMVQPSLAQENSPVALVDASVPRLNLTASASRQVYQDTIRLSLVKEVHGSNPQAISQELNRSLQAVTQKAKGNDKISLKTGQYQVWLEPSDDKSKSQYAGSAQLIVSGHDFAQASQFVQSVSDQMVLDDVYFSLSDQVRQKVETELRDQAIQAFRAKAQASAKAFGFSSYQIAEVSLQDSEGQGVHRPMMLRSAKVANYASADSVPLKSGQEQVQVSVSGQVILKP